MRRFCILLMAFVVAGANSRAERPPNIVFVLADDLGYGDLSCFGQQRFSTPRLDELAALGRRLTQHYAGSTVCAPSRCALMTGRHTGHCFVRGNREHKPEGQIALPADAVTIAELLRDAGYTTGAFGKWGLGYPGSEGSPLRQGFDRFYGYNCQRHAHRYYTDYLWDDDRRIPFDPDRYTHDAIVEQAIKFIRTNRDRPFFCFLPVTIPHAAMEAPEADRARWREVFAEYDEEVGRYAGVKTRNPRASFAAMVTRLDRDTGRIVDLLQELGIDDQTLIAVTSDNGPHQEGGHRPDFFNSNGPFRGHKRDLYEGGIRMPTIVAWPGRVPASTSSDEISAGWDWLPTLCEVAGVDPPEGIDGVSLLPSLTGNGEQEQPAYRYWEFHEQGGKQAIRQGRWKAIRLNVKRGATRTELYDIDADPGETTDLAAERPQITAELASLMDTARTPSDVFPFAPPAARSAGE